MMEYTNFRQRLDAALRTLNLEQVQRFLIEEKQWSADALPPDPEFSMWMMIAGSPTLRDLHEKAWVWLTEHGHAEEAQALLGREKKQGAEHGGGGRRHPRTNAKKKSSPQGHRKPH